MSTVVMPPRHRPAVQPRSGHEDVARLERLLSKDPGCRLALLEPGPANDIDSRHAPADERVIQKVLVMRRARRPSRGHQIVSPGGGLTQFRDFGERAF